MIAIPRPPKKRRVEKLPPANNFKPGGVPRRDLESLTLKIDESEALRLSDVEDLDQETAAKRMEVSRATFQRILSSARQKVSRAIWEGKALEIEGGPYRLAKRSMRCYACDHEFQVPFGDKGPARRQECPECGERAVRRVKP